MAILQDKEQFSIDKSDETQALFGGTVAYKWFDRDYLDKCGSGISNSVPVAGVPLNPCAHLLSNLDANLKSKITLPEPTRGKWKAQVDYFAKRAKGRFWLGLYTKTYTTVEHGCKDLLKYGRCYNYMTDDPNEPGCFEIPKSEVSRATDEPNGCDETYIAYQPEMNDVDYHGLMDLGSHQDWWKSEVFCVYIAPTISEVCIP